MERVAFLVESSGARLRCLLNPENIVHHRAAGITVPHYAQGSLSGRGAAANAALFNGGGFSEIDLDLVFDVTLAQGTSIRSNDVRDHTRPITDLVENQPTTTTKLDHPPYVRFVWGKTWNIRAVISTAAERLEYFDASGVPRRSWLRLRLLQVPDEIDTEESRAQIGQIPLSVGQAKPPTSEADDVQIHTTAAAIVEGGRVSADRLDTLAQRYYNHPGKWRVIADANSLSGIDNLPPGLALTIPALAQ
jgi:hypothetical protein